MPTATITFRECPHCGVLSRFRYWKRVRARLYAFECGRKMRYFYRWARVSRTSNPDFATCAACHETVST
jgi:hypothetical protein